MTGKCPPSTCWPTGDLDKKSWRASDCWTREQGEKRPHYHSVSAPSNYLSVFLSPDSEFLQGRSHTRSNLPRCLCHRRVWLCDSSRYTLQTDRFMCSRSCQHLSYNDINIKIICWLQHFARWVILACTLSSHLYCLLSLRQAEADRWGFLRGNLLLCNPVTWGLHKRIAHRPLQRVKENLLVSTILMLYDLCLR